MRISDGSSDVCSSDLRLHGPARALRDRGAVAVSRAGFIFDRNEARIDEALERRAFPELDREPEPAPAAMRAAWNWLDTLYAIDAAEAILRRGYSSAERRVGEECGRTCRTWWSPYQYKKKKREKKQV